MPPHFVGLAVFSGGLLETVNTIDMEGREGLVPRALLVICASNMTGLVRRRECPDA